MHLYSETGSTSWIYIALEPPLQQLTRETIVPATANQQDEVHADIHGRGLWVDVTVPF